MLAVTPPLALAAIPSSCKLIAFDLDGTVWNPDLYELWGGGSPFKVVDPLLELRDRSNRKLVLCGGGFVGHILHHVKASGVKIAWVSCTDEPTWADECLKKFELVDKTSLHSCASSSQVYKANKQEHFRRLKEEFPLVEYEEMLFFDNEMGNIKSVSKLGVKCVYCPQGCDNEAWLTGMRLFTG